MKKQKNQFTPQEIIFAATDACNLLCPHCFVSRTHHKLDIQKAKDFITSATKNGNITKIGFSGGEPFLYMDFLVQIISFAVKSDLLFDQIMTNGDWWKDISDLKEKLQQIYDAGYDGKIGLSYDQFHNQNPERIAIFMDTVAEIFGEGVINVQTVLGEKINKGDRVSSKKGWFTNKRDRDTCESLDSFSYEVNDIFTPPRNAPIYYLQQSFPGNDKKAWQSKKWFKEDYCQGPGQILYIHPDGNVAPCCGFANENPALFIGTIDDSFEKIMDNAATNKMIKICYCEGLSKYRKILKKQLKKQGTTYPGKTSDICSFCDYICKNNLI